MLNRSSLICSKLESDPLFRSASSIALYHSIPGEVHTHELINRYYPEKIILLPVITGEEMCLLPYTGKVKAGALGISEPVCDDEICKIRPDVIIVPGIAFDRNLNRMGRGKGYYDRYLSGCEIPKIGLCYDFQLQEQIPVDSHDQPMDRIITEKEIIG